MNNYGKVYLKENLKKHTTFGIGGTCKYLIEVENEEKLSSLIKMLNEKKIQYFILGNGSNVIMDDEYFDGVVIKLNNLNTIEFSENEVKVGSGVLLPYLNNVCMLKGYTNLFFCSMIPGTIGGSVVGNAGCYNHEIMEYVKNVTVLDKNGNIKTISKKDISFGYRYTSLKDKYIVLSCTLILKKGDVVAAKKEMVSINEKRKLSQPLDKKCVGSIFRNPEGTFAGKLIEDLGLKGKEIGGAKISEKHANFIVNEKNASFNDVISLIDIVKKEVNVKNNIDLVVEPTIVKWEK